MAAIAPSTPAQPMTAVAISAGGVIAIPLADAKRKLVIGRAEDADLVIDDPSVSRRHAVLHLGHDIELEDLGSENGTLIIQRASSHIYDTPRLVPRRIHRGERVVVGSMMHAQLGMATLLLQPGTPSREAAPPHEPIALPEGVVVTSAAMKHVYWLAERFARGAINVLVVGETGVGKEVVAEHIHRASPRRAGPFIQLNCASFRGELLEIELFGYERGAFTGAGSAKPGLVEAAAGGTLFLDEIAEMPLDMQARLLRFLGDRRATRVGSTESCDVDVRIVSATNRDLSAEVRAGRFRNDLYFRLNGASIHIPPLRSRPADIAPLAQHFVRVHAAAQGLSPAPVLEPAALAALAREPLPGNAREVRNLIERAMLLAEPGQPLRVDQLMLATEAPASPAVVADVEQPVDEEKLRVLAALEACGGNQTRAAQRLGITRRTLIVRLDRYGVIRPRRDSSEREARDKA